LRIAIRVPFLVFVFISIGIAPSTGFRIVMSYRVLRSADQRRAFGDQHRSLADRQIPPAKLVVYGPIHGLIPTGEIHQFDRIMEILRLANSVAIVAIQQDQALPPDDQITSLAIGILSSREKAAGRRL
jgi:hypothetical protein